MAGVTAAVIGAGAAIKGAVDSRKAAKKASKDVKEANIQSAAQLAEAGSKAEKDILAGAERAVETVGKGVLEAEGRIDPFVQPGQDAFTQAQEQIMGNLPISGPLADSIRNASTEFVRSKPHLFNLTQPVSREVDRQGDLTVSAVTPAFTENLLTAGQQGLAATGDVAGIRQRGLERLGDIAQGSASQRASAIVGQTPQLAQLSAGANEARLLGQAAGQQGTTNIAETLANLAGRNF